MKTQGGHFKSHLKNQHWSALRPYVAKRYYETYKSFDHMQKFRPITQKINEISIFGNVETSRFVQTWTYEYLFLQ